MIFIGYICKTDLKLFKHFSCKSGRLFNKYENNIAL